LYLSGSVFKNPKSFGFEIIGKIILTQETINNPSLTLYAFHLRNDAANKTEVTPNAAHLWEKLVQLGEDFSASLLQKWTDNLICYQKGQYKPLVEPASLFLELIEAPNHELRFSLSSQKALYSARA